MSAKKFVCPQLIAKDRCLSQYETGPEAVNGCEPKNKRYNHIQPLEQRSSDVF